MTTALKLRRGTTAQHASFTGAAGEVTVDTTKKTAVVHDGSTAGGTPLARESALAAKADTTYVDGRLNTTFAFKNRIINGDMRIDQRNAGASITPGNGSYTLDRWVCFGSVGSRFTVQQNAGSVTPPAGFSRYLGVTSNSAHSVGAGDFFSVEQPIEGFNASDFSWGTANARAVTVSFWVRSSLTGTFGGAFYAGTGSLGYAFSYSISSANTWEYKTVTIAGPTTGTWASNNTNFGNLLFSLGMGSNFSVSPGSWTSGTIRSATGSTSVVGTNGATFYITGVQLEVGSSATPFDTRAYGTELALCQRYFEQSYDIGTVAGEVSNAGAISTFPAAFAVYFPILFKVTKRATPTINTFSPLNGVSGNYQYNNTTNVPLSGILSAGMNGAVPYTGSTPGNVSAYLHYTASAEL